MKSEHLFHLQNLIRHRRNVVLRSDGQRRPIACQFCQVCSTATSKQKHLARTTRFWVISNQIVLDGPPFPTLMLGQDAVVHDSGNHEPSDVIHLVAAIWGFRTMVVHLGQAEPSLRSESFSLCLFVFLCQAMNTILLPTAMRLGMQVELLGLTIACRMTALVQATFRTGCSLKDLATISGLVSGLQRLFAGTKRLRRSVDPGHTVRSIPSVAWLGVGTTGDMPRDAFLIQFAVDIIIIEGTVGRHCLGFAQTLDVGFES